jgi:hypothetical protein
MRMRQIKKTQTTMVSKRSVLGRVNRRPETDSWHRMKGYRGRWKLSEDNRFGIDIQRNAVIAQHRNLEAPASSASWSIMRNWKMTKGSIRRLEDTAQHEVGHEVTAVEFRKLFRFVTIEPGDGSLSPQVRLGKCMPRHRAQEFRKFLDEIERNVPTDLDMHVVMDNA